MNNNNVNVYGGNSLEYEIRNNGVLYFLRSTPFTEYGIYNYNGLLKPQFFFDNLFTKKGNCDKYCNEIIDEIIVRHKKTVILIGNQGCGKTTFVHYLKNKMTDKRIFNILDFDKDTSNPKLEEYIEIFSSYLHNLIRKDYRNNKNIINKLFNNIYTANKSVILNTINGANNVETFFKEFKKVFIDENFENNDCSNFINNINELFFNQILSLIILWHIADFSYKKVVSPMVFCLDNLDVLVNSDIITGFFEEYFIFLRNIDSIIQKLECRYINDTRLDYDKTFTFIFSCRQHTWAKVKQSYIHQSNVITLSTFDRNITDAFDKNAILEQRELYIKSNPYYNHEFSTKLDDIKSLLEDMHERNNIYDFFNDDYRQCSVTFEKLLDKYPDLLSEYAELKQQMSSKPLYGARGLVYKALFDIFRDTDLFKLIGVLDIDSSDPYAPPVSDARIILSYLDYHTFDNHGKSVAYEQIVRDFNGIIDEERINYCLINMFNLGIGDSLWNELIAFVQIDSDELQSCKGTKIFITKAGHEYLDLISTHFEFFNIRVTAKRKIDAALYSKINLKPYQGHKDYIYNFQETIQNVIDVVDGCCQRMSKFHEEIMFKKYNGKERYLNSEFVYNSADSKSKVFHGERIIHTHIRYIDQYRLFVLKNQDQNTANDGINEILVNYIKNYINIGKNNPNILSSKSLELFAEFDKKINHIESTAYSDYTTAINL